jgi:hypothetical protein
MVTAMDSSYDFKSAICNPKSAIERGSMRTQIILLAVVMAGTALAKVDLVTLPARDTVQLTIYNSADLTLARESRALTLNEGLNKLQFSWENTLIDPTSLEMSARAQQDRIEVSDLTYPARVRNLGLWNIKSQVKGKVPVEISYLTSGLSWRAFYTGTLSTDEKVMHLEGYVRVTNNSGEDYENAQVRLVVGQVHLLDRIAELAQRQYPYGTPLPIPMLANAPAPGVVEERLNLMAQAKSELAFLRQPTGAMAPKEIEKEGLSEYFLYTIEGTETIPNGWSKRMISFTTDQVPVVNLYKHEESRYGASVMRFLSFKNDKEHKLGLTPIPEGGLEVCRTVDDKEHLSYVGQTEFKYIPVGSEVELELGPVSDVVVEPRPMNLKMENYRFDSHGNVSGCDEVQTFKVEARNTRDIPIELEIRRSFPTTYWDLDKKGQIEGFEKVDKDTVKFVIRLAARTARTFEYTVRLYQGTREESWRP